MIKIAAEDKRILVINCGSSSLKYEVYAMPSRTSLGKGLVEKIGLDKGILTQKSANGTIELNVPIPDHTEALSLVTKCLIDSEKGILSNLDELSGIGHRVVHGGEDYSASVLIDNKVTKAVEDNIKLAPLHNPANLKGILVMEKLLPETPQVAVFDTSFHQTIPAKAYLYGLPRELYDEEKIRKYGFHGTSHRYVANETVEFLKRSKDNTNIISCHLGNGASVTAIRNGESVDTSMGFTPLEGLVMGTRCGDMDPAVVLHLQSLGKSPEEVNKIINKQGGMMGLSGGLSSDLRDLEGAAKDGNSKAREALEVFAYRVRKYIGSYMATLGKVDAILFTGGIGEWGTLMRERILEGLYGIGIDLDHDKNMDTKAELAVISKENSPITILVVPTNEELQIAMDTEAIINQL